MLHTHTHTHPNSPKMTDLKETQNVKHTHTHTHPQIALK